MQNTSNTPGVGGGITMAEGTITFGSPAFLLFGMFNRNICTKAAFCIDRIDFSASFLFLHNSIYKLSGTHRHAYTHMYVYTHAETCVHISTDMCRHKHSCADTLMCLFISRCTYIPLGPCLPVHLHRFTSTDTYKLPLDHSEY